MENLAENIINRLPHGSGIDCEWKYKSTSQSIRFSNSFHCMNENGYYDGFADFTVIIPLKNGRLDTENFTLQFNGKFSQYQNYKYMLRDYLEDTIYYALTN